MYGRMAERIGRLIGGFVRAGGLALARGASGSAALVAAAGLIAGGLVVAGCSEAAPLDPGGDDGNEGPFPGPTPSLVPIDMMEGTYHGRPGGLIDNGSPSVTPADGRIVIIAISMSNGNLEFNRFMELYGGHPDVEPGVGLVNCARGGNALERWLELQSLWDDCRDRILAAGFTPDQVRVVWAKNANQFTDHGRTLPDPGADYYDLVANISALSERIGVEFPSVQAVFHTSRIYAGYAEERLQAARGEPISYEGGLAVNAAIERWQRGELPGAPWIGWGPYLWANAATPNASGILWLPEDFRDGGLNHHPSEAGQTKVADALHQFFMAFDWYRR